MLGILLMILKVIGWLLLGILGLLFVVVCLVLFVPVPYRVWVNGSPEDDPVVCCKVKVFGIQVFPRKGKKKEAGDTTEAADAAEPAETAAAPQESAGVQKEPKTAAQQAAQEKSTAQQPAGTDTENTDNSDTSSDKNTDQNSAKKETETAQPSEKKQEQKFSEGVRDTMKRIRTELTDAGNRRAVLHLLREVKKLLRHIGPRRVMADVSFSLGDPANTGYATAALSVCPFVYGKKCRITPDFVTEELYIRGWMDVRGHVRIIHVVAAGLRLLFDRDIRRIIKKLRR